MANLLIVYGTTEGQTAKIAETMAKTLTEKGHKVEVDSAETAPEGAELNRFDGFVVGSSVHVLKFNKKLREWSKRNFVFLQRKPSAFFSVCLGVLEKTLKTNRKEREIMENFFRETGWSPEFDAIFAGALKYSRYGWFKKRILRAIAKKAGSSDTDMTRDYEYTNWDAVRDFSLRFEGGLGVSGTVHALSKGKG